MRFHASFHSVMLNTGPGGRNPVGMRPKTAVIERRALFAKKRVEFA